MTECNRPGLLTSGDQFSRTLTPHNNSDQQRVFKYTHYPGSNPIIRIEGTWDMGDNLSPNAGPAVCQKVYRDLREGYEDVSFQFDFAPPAEGGPMMLADVVVKKHS